MRKNYITVLFAVFCLIVPLQVPAYSVQKVVASITTEAPIIDGSAKDKVWEAAKAVVVRDKRLHKDITVKAAYTEDMVFLLVSYADPTEDRLHKPWVWNKEMEIYGLADKREDVFMFRWNMGVKDVDLSSFSDDDYTSDVWYWKANRTDPVGHADDKYHTLTGMQTQKNSGSITSSTGKFRYLTRIADSGRSSYRKRILTEYKGQEQTQYEIINPEGSRADVRARGVWKDGIWTIEFGRKLDTGHSDDASFDISGGKKYQFVISILSLYGEEIDENKPNLYGQGRASEPLSLFFK